MSNYTFDSGRPVLIIGTGVMGSLVAWACARSGIPVHAFDAEAGRAQAALDECLGWSPEDEQRVVKTNFQVFDNLEQASSGVQLAFENTYEDLAVKTEILGRVARLLPPHVFMGSNASSLPCSPLAEASGRPDRFFNLNFTDPRISRLVELMGCPATSPETIVFAKQWARHLGMIPLHVTREQMGYSFNRIWRVIKKEVLRQIAEGYATAENIDRAWMLSFGTDSGPCGMMDSISLPTVKKVEQQYYLDSGEEGDKPPEFLTQMIDQGSWGVASGQGFYRYPNPAYRQPGWLEDSDWKN